MTQVTPNAMLELWEKADGLHPIDRNLLLVHQVRPDLPVSLLADMPLGFINITLLQMRLALFGRTMSAIADCPHCQQILDLSLDSADMLEQLQSDNTGALRTVFIECEGYRFRSPTSRDLAVIYTESNPLDYALHLFQRCCVRFNEPTCFGDQSASEKLMTRATELFDELDPAADLGFSIICEHCGQTDTISLDIGDYLWREIDRYIRSLLLEIHTLASAYGWSETMILALSANRRRQYLSMVMA